MPPNVDDMSTSYKHATQQIKLEEVLKVRSALDHKDALK